MRIVTIILVFLSLAYLMTGLVYEEGGFGVRLVIKPTPGLSISFGGGEEGAWERAHHNAAAPWWRQDRQMELVRGDWEEGQPIWLGAYMLGFVLTALSWPILLGVFVARKISKKRRADSHHIG